MHGKPITKEEVQRIIFLRQTGHSLPEIIKEVRRGSSTVHEHIKNVKVLPEFKAILREKQGGSKIRSAKAWGDAERRANELISEITKKEKFLIASCLYWGEGTKKDFSLSNTDPDLIKVFIICLEELGITKKDLKITVRIYEDLNREKIIKYWAHLIGVSKKCISNVNILKGKKIGKLPYGMCRIRVIKGGKYLKLLQSIKRAIIYGIISPHSSVDRTRDS